MLDHWFISNAIFGCHSGHNRQGVGLGMLLDNPHTPKKYLAQNTYAPRLRVPFLNYMFFIHIISVLTLQQFSEEDELVDLFFSCSAGKGI